MNSYEKAESIAKDWNLDKEIKDKELYEDVLSAIREALYEKDFEQV